MLRANNENSIFDVDNFSLERSFIGLRGSAQDQLNDKHSILHELFNRQRFSPYPYRAKTMRFTNIYECLSKVIDLDVYFRLY